ncbi:MAG: hypothetical protein ACREVL_04445 [Solimonas sp.]
MSRVLRRSLSIAGLALALAGAGPAQAGRPLVTDDATVTPAGECQLESWYQDDPHGDVFNLFPACNLFGDTELTAGWAHGGGNAYSLQAKQVYRELKPDSWGWGLAAGVVRELPARGEDGYDWYAYVPLSLSLDDDRWQLHLNLGAGRHEIDDRLRANWGLGAVYAPSPRWSFFGEGYGSNETANVQGGGSLTLLADRAQLDVTLGRVLHGAGEGNYAGIGIDLYGFAF